jgi:hypothetical protein
MISPLITTDSYILQQNLLSKHKKTLEWLSAIVLWKRELAFFQKLLDQFVSQFSSTEEKKKIDHFQSIIIYYKNELMDSFASKLRQHEKNLADMLQNHNESNVSYFTEHDQLMNEVESASAQLAEYKEAFFAFIERAM